MELYNEAALLDYMGFRSSPQILQSNPLLLSSLQGSASQSQSEEPLPVTVKFVKEEKKKSRNRKKNKNKKAKSQIIQQEWILIATVLKVTFTI